MKTVEISYKPHLDAVVVRPGDTLIVRVPGPLSREDADRLKDGLEELLPGVTPVLISAEQILVYRPDGE